VATQGQRLLELPGFETTTLRSPAKVHDHSATVALKKRYFTNYFTVLPLFFRFNLHG